MFGTNARTSKAKNNQPAVSKEDPQKGLPFLFWQVGKKQYLCP